MSAKNKDPYQKYIKKEDRKVMAIICLGLLGLLAVYALVTFYLSSPYTIEFRKTAGAFLLENAIWLAIVSCLAFSKKIAMPISGKIVIYAYVVLKIILELWQPGRVAYVFLLVYAIANAIVALLIYKKTGKDFLSVYAFGILAFINVVLLSYHTTNVNGSIAFWKIPLAIAIVATVISIIYCSKNISKLRAKGKGQKSKRYRE